MFAVGIAQSVDATFHFILRDIQRHGMYSLFVVYGGFGKNGYEIAFSYQFQKNVHLVQFYFHLERMVCL